MNILSLSDDGDAGGGQGIRLKEAFDRYTDWTFRSVTHNRSYIAFPEDVWWDDDLVRHLYQRADVVHTHNGIGPAHRIDPSLSKPLVVHHHGTYFRHRPQQYLNEDREHGAVSLLSTLDLWLLAPETIWLPTPYDVEWLGSLRRETPGPLRIVHSPTSRKVKGTDAFLNAAERLVSEGHPVTVDLIEQASWAECLRRKATADIFFDQLILGYGGNAVEAWGMGIPVIAGGAPDTLAEMGRRFGELPFLDATEDTLYDALLALITDPHMRAEYGRRGLDFARRYHDSHVIVAQLQAIYRAAV